MLSVRYRRRQEAGRGADPESEGHGGPECRAFRRDGIRGVLSVGEASPSSESTDCRARRQHIRPSATAGWLSHCLLITLSRHS